ncbi:MFS general substrate transporter [Athelia psychrophila]|uniref:MFS general substrate transporter n=1 Tax=Athelia psychrophila TaxID=1759441 RepID=A0A166GSJ3_9AGAM|nr:MFS general substrate transporter [Fibularhizoctonia sp. CBS 109695]
MPLKTADSQSIYLSTPHPSLNLSLSQTSVQTVQTKAQKRWTNVQFASLCFSLFLAGWNDGTTGPLLPRIQEVYHVGFAVVSMIFVFACVGFISGAFLNFAVTDRFGFGKVIVFGAFCQVIAYTLEAAGEVLPFPAFVLGYAINGIGMALQDAQANGYVAGLRDNKEAKMGMLHAAYGAGAFASPLVATQFAQAQHWSFHYLASLGIALLNAVVLIAIFRLKSQDECYAEVGQAPQEQGTSADSKFRQVFALKAVHLLAFFILVYVGVEVTIGGWIVTFIIQVRGGGASSGYISAGFFGGLMVGRVALLWVNQKIGERRVLFIYSLLAIGLELIVWFVPSLIGDGVAVSIVGVLLGPIYPIVMNESSRILPRWLLTGSIGWIAGFGQAGSALFPFITGALASKVGIKSLQPLLVGMMSLMVGLWMLVPAGQRKVD